LLETLFGGDFSAILRTFYWRYAMRLTLAILPLFIVIVLALRH
jgi:hypothetical protein